MTSEKLTAHFENREYFFYVVKKVPADRQTGAPEELHITMYGQPYVFQKMPDKWINKDGNKMNMALGLIEAVIVALQPKAQE
ncbi:hypothetical protein MKQ70_03620 [Chitinophaga sedimenti]|uniref:hypothetical protein n=1 Tax=Chitinophaga sedimenti TaxID=2033606 RepID=UPI0020052142|nr:hypothetical protein [Chitinophaga sedimenti]MCK7554144.1 hypothetical protein [Chitinophaga sedimenti]